jgi:hypothetical protein
MNDEIQEIADEVQRIQEGHTDMLDGNETVSDRLVILCYRLLNIIYNMKGIK